MAAAQQLEADPNECPICMEITGGPVLPLIHTHETEHTQGHKACERCRRDMKERGHPCPWCRDTVAWRPTLCLNATAPSAPPLPAAPTMDVNANRLAEDEAMALALSAQFADNAGRQDEDLARRLAAEQGAVPPAVDEELQLPPGIKPCPACGMLLEKISGDANMMCGCEARPAGGTTEKALAGGGCGHEFNFDTLAPIAFGMPGNPAHPRQKRFEAVAARRENHDAPSHAPGPQDVPVLPPGIKPCPACGMLLEKISGDEKMMCGCEARVAGGTLEKALRGGGCGHEFNFDTLRPIAFGRPGHPAHPRQKLFYRQGWSPLQAEGLWTCPVRMKNAADYMSSNHT